MAHNVSICVRAGLPKPRLVPDTERTKDTKTLDYASTPLDANTLLQAVGLRPSLSAVLSVCGRSLFIVPRVVVSSTKLNPIVYVF